MQKDDGFAGVPFRKALRVWWALGWLSFGGPAGQIALMHRMLVEERGWIDERRFLHALNYCMLLPGPEAMQLATYIGWLLHGVRGGLVAGILFVLPGALLILALSWCYVLLGDFAIVEGLFFGLKAAVLAIVVQALLKVAGRTLSGTGALKPALALAAFVALFAFNLPFPLVVLGAGMVGWLASRQPGGDAVVGSAEAPPSTRRGTGRAALICAALWVLTLVLPFGLRGGEDTFARIAAFFSAMAVVTFGGAYAVLAWVAQQAVEVHGWLQPGEMLDGLGLAETTPGPLILVTQFVGFLGAMRQSGMEPALLAGTLGALLTVWVTFLPCFLWIFAGAPHVERLRHHRRLAATLAAITAAVVGVIANLAVWFAMNFLFAEQAVVDGFGLELRVPAPSSLDPVALAMVGLALLMVFVFRLGLLTVLAASALVGMALRWA